MLTFIEKDFKPLLVLLQMYDKTYFYAKLMQ